MLANLHSPPPHNTLYIIIPIYNVAPYLVECLDSIKSQTFANLKAILIDDCSKDNSAQIAGKYAQNDKRFILIKKPVNEGLGAARNTGLDYIFHTLKPKNSDYIGFVDSDDVVAVDYFANLIYCLESHKKHGIMVAKSYNIYHFKHWDYDKAIFARRLWKTRGMITRKSGRNEAWRALYRAEFLRNLRFPNVRLHEDKTFGSVVSALAGKIAFTISARYFYRERMGSLLKEYRYLRDEQFANFAYMLEHFAKFDLLKTNAIKIDLVENLGAEWFEKLQNLVRGYDFNESILRVNPNLRSILEANSYDDFQSKIAKAKPLKERVRRYFRIDIRLYKIYIKLFGKVLCDKSWR